jgi:hypothetical protein
MGFKSHIWRKKKRVSSGFARVMGRPARSPGFDRAVALAGLLVNPDRSNHQVNPLGRAGFNNTGQECLERVESGGKENEEGEMQFSKYFLLLGNIKQSVG